jgi:hypothetical protein
LVKLEDFFSVLIDDLEIFKEGLKREDFSFCNILSNRLITDAVFLNSKGFVLLGVILKENLNYFALLEDFKIVKGEYIEFINEFNQSEDLDLERIINRYINFYDKIWVDISPEHEKYEKNLDYSLFSTKYVINFLIDNLERQDVPYIRDSIIYGATNELNRIYRNFGALKYQLMLKTVLYLSGKLYDYYRVLILSTSSKKEIWKEKIISLKLKIKNNIRSFKIEKKYLENSLDLLFEISKQWRHLFIKVGELSLPIQREKTTIPPEIQQELEEIVSKVTESELKSD